MEQNWKVKNFALKGFQKKMEIGMNINGRLKLFYQRKDTLGEKQFSPT